MRAQNVADSCELSRFIAEAVLFGWFGDIAGEAFLGFMGCLVFVPQTHRSLPRREEMSAGGRLVDLDPMQFGGQMHYSAFRTEHGIP